MSSLPPSAHLTPPASPLAGAASPVPADEVERDLRQTLRAIVELCKPGITRMVLITTALGVLAAPVGFAWSDLLITTVGVALVVAGANALNMFMERDSDRYMTRTQGRPLPSGRLNPDEALAFGVLVSILGLFLLAQFVSMAAVGLSAFALLSYVLVYTPMKKVHSVALYVGAVPGALPPAIGYAALTGTVDGVGLALFLILFVWQLPHFLAISLFRKEEYAKAGLRVLPNERGVMFTKWTAFFQSIALLWVCLWPATFSGIAPFYVWVAGFCGLAYLACSAWGLRPSAGNRWARIFFFASLPYLPIVMSALVLAVN